MVLFYLPIQNWVEKQLPLFALPRMTEVLANVHTYRNTIEIKFTDISPYLIYFYNLFYTLEYSDSEDNF